MEEGRVGGEGDGKGGKDALIRALGLHDVPQRGGVCDEEGVFLRTFISERVLTSHLRYG